MSHELRIQRKRTAGWKMPSNAVYVGRPTEFGNSYRAGDIIELATDDSLPEPPTGDETMRLTKQDAVDFYRKELLLFKKQNRSEWKRWCKELQGKQLACWCSLNDPCHADVLAEMVNQ